MRGGVCEGRDARPSADKRSQGRFGTAWCALGEGKAGVASESRGYLRSFHRAQDGAGGEVERWLGAVTDPETDRWRLRDVYPGERQGSSRTLIYQSGRTHLPTSHPQEECADSAGGAGPSRSGSDHAGTTGGGEGDEWSDSSSQEQGLRGGHSTYYPEALDPPDRPTPHPHNQGKATSVAKWMDRAGRPWGLHQQSSETLKVAPPS